MRVLSLNVGSSSIKFAVYDLGKKELLLFDGAIKEIGQKKIPTHEQAFRMLFDTFAENEIEMPNAVGHRVVFGGPKFYEPAKIDASLLSELKRLTPFAPLHLPLEIAAMNFTRKNYPQIPQVACFDTAFHNDLPDVSRTLPLPSVERRYGLRRYGFHGLSYEYILSELPKKARGRVVIAHLGNGASMAAVKNGKCIDTTMGLTPTGGLMMGTRTGDLDPGILVYLMQEKGYDAEKIDQLVNFRSGLLGVSGRSSDFQMLMKLRAGDEGAALAVNMFCYQASKSIAGLASALEGLDTLVFTGGIGEHSAEVRAKICKPLGFFGLFLDPKRNRKGAGKISSKNSACLVKVIPTNEELVIARHVMHVLG
jgi:acetate kinase